MERCRASACGCNIALVSAFVYYCCDGPALRVAGSEVPRRQDEHMFAWAQLQAFVCHSSTDAEPLAETSEVGVPSCFQ